MSGIEVHGLRPIGKLDADDQSTNIERCRPLQSQTFVTTPNWHDMFISKFDAGMCAIQTSFASTGSAHSFECVCLCETLLLRVLRCHGMTTC